MTQTNKERPHVGDLMIITDEFTNTVFCYFFVEKTSVGEFVCLSLDTLQFITKGDCWWNSLPHGYRVQFLPDK